MLVDVEPLHMVRLRLDLPAMLRRTGIPPAHDSLDLGYLVHWHLVSLFGNAAPPTFALRGESGRWVEVLGYAEAEAEVLRTLVRDDRADGVCDWKAFESRPLPRQWRTGAALSFEVRVCPVVRRAKDGPRQRRGAEVDVFLTACEAAGNVPVDRMDVYRKWLAQQFVRSGGADLLAFEATTLRRSRLHRLTQGRDRRACALERPDLLARGALSIRDGGAFDRLLRRGVGRHRAFGFGMLLLMPRR